MDAQRGNRFDLVLAKKKFDNLKNASEALRNLFLGGEIAIGDEKQIGTDGSVPLYGKWAGSTPSPTFT
jgi:hypothetical protein